MKSEFPEDFRWGASTSAYQIEGGWDADGKGRSVWDLFVAREGKIWKGQDARVSCDHYHRFKEDVSLMAQIGMTAYRFSISWPRVMPNGDGDLNEAGLVFYDALIDELLAHGIEPWVTLFHWDFPHALFLRGGWLNRSSSEWFAKYTKVIVDRFSDRVDHWTTINEPQCFIGMGHNIGSHAPGLNLSMEETLLAGHHALLAHGRSVQVIREFAKLPPTIGWTPAGSVYRPATDSLDDVNAAREATSGIYAGNFWNMRWWSDPVLLGHYPEEGLRVYGDAVPEVPASDFDIIKQPIDFYGCNLFQSTAVHRGKDQFPVAAELEVGCAMSLAGWAQAPESLYWGLRFIHELYELPIVVTENGCSTLDWISSDGSVHDSNRVDFITGNLLSLQRAMSEGFDVRGYFHSSLLDHFDWQHGYGHRYGLIFVDYSTQTRTLKDSAYCYKELIASNGQSLQRYLHDEDSPVPFVVKAAMRYIDSNISETFNVKTIAGHLNCHPDFLSRRFKQHTGVSLSAHIRSVRVAHARSLLRNPQIMIGAVADACGFSDHIHFGKVFKKEMGMTAGQYQKRFRSEGTQDLPPPIEISRDTRLS
ncbi:MAG: beta-glucosidase [Puniceicoccaceae bacterium]|nr:beta-glucosidase [Puniceicoccaceae bacterium]|tara:strand:+ start:4396 stop:6162 length:1767 start_codon:yes stop_codon:yes gene_type:complete